MVDRRGTAQSRASALRRASRTRRHCEAVGPVSAKPPDGHDADQWVDAIDRCIDKFLPRSAIDKLRHEQKSYSQPGLERDAPVSGP